MYDSRIWCSLYNHKRMCSYKYRSSRLYYLLIAIGDLGMLLNPFLSTSVIELAVPYWSGNAFSPHTRSASTLSCKTMVIAWFAAQIVNGYEFVSNLVIVIRTWSNSFWLLLVSFSSNLNYSINEVFHKYLYNLKSFFNFIPYANLVIKFWVDHNDHGER